MVLSCTTATSLSDVRRPGAPWGAEANCAGRADLRELVETLGLFQGAVKGEAFAQCGALLRDVLGAMRRATLAINDLDLLQRGCEATGCGECEVLCTDPTSTG